MHVTYWIFYFFYCQLKLMPYRPISGLFLQLKAASGTVGAWSPRSCSTYRISASMLVWDIFLPWFLIKAKVDCCCQLRKQDCNDSIVPKVIAFISTFFITSFGKWLSWHEGKEVCFLLQTRQSWLYWGYSCIKSNFNTVFIGLFWVLAEFHNKSSTWY